MNITGLIAYCRRRGIEFRLGNGTIQIHGAAGLVEEMLPVLRTRKDEIITYLAIETRCARHIREIHDSAEPVLSEAQAEVALIETQALLNRVMSRRA